MLLLRNIAQRLFNSPTLAGAVQYQLNVTQIRTKVIYYTPRPTEVKRVRKQGYKTRAKTETGRRYMMTRLLKGDKCLAQ